MNIDDRFRNDFIEVEAKNPLPEGTRLFNIYTKTDGIIRWESCLHPKATECIEVRGTHTGLAWNKEVYGAVAKILARKEPLQVPSAKPLAA